MKNFLLFKTAFLTLAILSFAGCQQPTTTTTTTNTVNQTVETNTNSNGNSMMMTDTNSNSGSSTTTATAVETNEPQQYQATVTLKLEAGGNDKKSTLPAITAQVARSGENRRMEFSLPNGEKVVYLDLGGKQFIISPQRKEYAELNKESVGIEVRRLLTPSQIVSQVKAMKGVERVGEEKYNGRDAIKYQYNAVTNTQTKAGNVDTSSVIYVDKETGLPLHSEISSVAQNGAVNGINNAHVVTEMSNIQTTADANLFAEPTDFKKVEPEQIRGQLQTVFNVVGTFIAQMMQQAQPAVSPSPTATSK